VSAEGGGPELARQIMWRLKVAELRELAADEEERAVPGSTAQQAARILEKLKENTARQTKRRKAQAEAAGFGSVTSHGYLMHVGGQEAVDTRKEMRAAFSQADVQRQRDQRQAAREAGGPVRGTLAYAEQRGGQEAVDKLREARRKKRRRWRMTQVAFRAELSMRPRGLHLMMDCPASLQGR
jgi:hypothetical protein